MTLIKDINKRAHSKPQKTWTVYMHIVPKEISTYDWDKYYVGITSKTLKKRSGSNGANYRNQLFGHAINKYGWANIKHEIIASSLTENEAKNFEKYLISKLQSNNNQYGYNISTGGDGSAGVIASNRKDLRGQKFGRWTVLDEEPIRHIMNSGREKLKWRCRCECGVYSEVYSDHLLQGKSQSCGCLSKDINSVRKGNNYDDIDYGMKLYLSNCDKSVVIDYDTYEQIKDYTWSYRYKDAAVVSGIGTHQKKHVINLLRLIVGVNQSRKRVYIHFLNNDEFDWRKENIYIDTPFNMSKDKYISALCDDIKGLSWSFSENRWIAKYSENKTKCFVDYESAKHFLLEYNKEAV